MDWFVKHCIKNFEAGLGILTMGKIRMKLPIGEDIKIIKKWNILL